MPIGEVERFRTASTEGHYRCALPTCASKLVAVGREGGSRRHHWRHPAGAAVHGPEGIWHLASKQLLATWAGRQVPTADVFVDDKRTPSGGQPDVWVTWSIPEPVGSVAFEVQYSTLTGRELAKRALRYVQDAVVDVWLFGHAQPHTRRRGDQLVLTETLRQVVVQGRQFFWINPDDLTVATPYVHRPETLAIRPDESWTKCVPELEFARHPRPSDELLSVGVDLLDDCRLDANGLHTPTADWVEQEIAAREECEGELRAAAREEAARREERNRHRAQERARRAAEPEEERPAAPNPQGRTRPSPERRAANPPPPAVYDAKARPCPACGGAATPRAEWPDWYRPPAWVHEVWQCSSCNLVLGS
jgi:hypothetical protein